MKTFQDYLDLYGWGGRKVPDGLHAPLVMMLKDEIATPGSTQLSQFDRSGLVQAAAVLQNTTQDEQVLESLALPFVSLSFDRSAIPILDTGGLSNDEYYALKEATYKKLAGLTFVHGEKDNPFTQHTDTISNDGTVHKDVSITTDLKTLKIYYEGNSSSAAMGWDIFEGNQVVTNPAILTRMFELVIQYGIDTPEGVERLYGKNASAVGSVASAIAHETKLPTVGALSDPAADQLFKAYIAYFGRPADPSGLQFWVDALNRTHGDVTDLVNAFGNSGEYREMYANSSAEQIVNALYQHLFNRDAESQGLQFWAHHLENGTLSLSEIAFTVLNSAQGSDSAIIDEKVLAARAFTSALDTRYEVDAYSNDTATLNARKWLSTVTADHGVNVKIVGIVNDVVNQLQHDVDPVLAANGLHAGHY